MKKPRTAGQNMSMDAAKEILQENSGKWIKGKELAAKISNHSKTSISEAYAKANLSTYREFLESKDNVKTKEEPEGQGRETIYWRLEK